MSDKQNVEQSRKKLYEEVWSEPMTIVAVRYGISDTGLRKRCKALNIPLPPAGYWAKVKAGKSVPVRTPLPSTIIDSRTDLNNRSSKSQNKECIIRFINTEELSFEQLRNMKDFDLLLPGSSETFTSWCNSISVPDRIHDYHALVVKHQSEIEYRQSRDIEHPFRDMGIKLWSPVNKVKYRDNEAVIPIDVSSQQYKRAYRIVDTIFKSLKALRGRFSVERGTMDNISIALLSTEISFKLAEQRTKRRYLNQQDRLKDLKPLYEEIYDGKLQISWTAHRPTHYPSNKMESAYLSYCDEEDKQLEGQIPIMILELYRLCCNNELINEIEQKERSIKYEEQRKKRSDEEYAEKQRMLEEERQAQKVSLISEIPNHAENWFMHNKLLKFADELENYLATCHEEEVNQLLPTYIKIIRKNADDFNPIKQIIKSLQEIELQE